MHMRTLAMTSVLGVLLATAASAQTDGPAANRVIRFSGAVADGAAKAGSSDPIRFAVYDREVGGALLWQEVQAPTVDASGSYSVFLGGNSADGLPLELFAGGEPRWLSVEVNGKATGPRSLLAAVPYAVSAATAGNAVGLAGRPASDYLLTPDARRRDAAAGGDAVAIVDPQVNNGSTGFIGKFFNTVDLDNSALFQSGSNIGLGTTAPLDVFHSRFTNNAGTQTGLAVQNLGSTTASYSGMLFYDHTGALRQFQGYNNGTGEYRINNISPSASINFMTGSTSRFFVATSGNVGIGNASPDSALHIGAGGNPILKIDGAVNQTGNGARLRWTETFPTDYGVEAMLDGGTDRLTFRNIENGAVTVDNILVINRLSGIVGIGTTTSTQARLQVGIGGSYDYGTRGVLNTGGATQLTNTGTSTNNSIYTDGYIWSEATFAISDARIKNIKGRSNGASDLATLMDVKVTDYSYIDTIAKGDGVQKKVIAQELEQVYPQAVRRGRDVVPDIYAMGTMADGWVALSTNLKPGDRVRLHSGNESNLYDVVEVGKDRFRTSLAAADGTKVFVYGREVDDFRVVDYEAIGMLNVSATQELMRKLQQQETETAALRQELAEMRTALTAALEAVAAAARIRQ